MDDSDPSTEGLEVMSQFMDVITTFKCKGCEIVCYKQDDLVEHIRATHLTQSSEIENSTDPSATAGEENSLEVSDIVDQESTSLIASLEEGSQAEQSIDGTFVESSDLQQINIQTYVNGTATSQVVLVDAGVDRSSANLFPANQPMLFLCGQCDMGFQAIEDCKAHMVREHKAEVDDLSNSKTIVDLDGGTLEDNLTFRPQSTEKEGAEANANTDLTVSISSDGQNGELTISERQEMPNGTVSMSTQVIKNKVGRKSKAELLELAKKENASPVKEADVAMVTGDVITIEQEDEEEDSTVTYIEIEVPGKRKRRAPKHLTDDYYVPRKTKYMTNIEIYDDMDGFSTSRRYRRGAKNRRRRSFSERIELPHKCERCRAKFALENQLEYHMKTHSDDVDTRTQLPLFKCPESTCQSDAFSTTLWADFKQHAWKVHQMDLGMIQCNVCDYRTTVHSKMSIHKQIHSTDKPYVCQVCQKAFKQQSQLKNHTLVHVAGVDIKEKESMSGRHWFVQAECNICKRTFANQKSLMCHIEAVHEKIKPYSCKFCGHTAARKAMMQLHMRTHTGEKPFKCSICEYVTADHNSMRRHRMRHTGDRPYQCPHCSYACIQAVSLKLHLKSKHPGSDRYYCCNKCPYRTVNKTLYTNHMRDHEIGLISEADLVPSSLVEAPRFGLGPITDMTDGTANVTQLIVSALNAIAPPLTDDGEPLPGNIETTIETIADTAEGVRAHKISFNIPATATKNAKTAEVIVQEQTGQPVMNLDPLQVAALESQIPTEELDVEERAQQVETANIQYTQEITSNETETKGEQPAIQIPQQLAETADLEQTPIVGPKESTTT